MIYVIRETNTGKMINCYEGEDCKQHAQDRVTTHNRFFPNDSWKLCEEAE